MPDTEKPNQKEHPDLYKRSIKGGYWVFGIKFATQFLGFVKSIIVFNFLFKQNLELIIVANLLMAALTTFSESGFRAALVQKKEDIEDYLDTAWVIGILRGILLFVAIYFAAPLFVSFQVETEKIPLAISVVRAMGVCFLIRAFQNIGTVYFQKELEFHKTFWLRMAGTLTDIALSIALVLIYKSVWAYVIARLAAAIVNLSMSYLLCSYRPKFHFVPQKARELWKFGKWLFGAKIIGYLLNEGDDLFVSFYLGGGPLKLYRYAYRFSQMPATHFASLISGVSFPAYSKIQHDLLRLRDAHLKVLQSTAMISVPMSFLIFVMGPDFVKLFLIEESHGMIPVVQILAVVGLITSLGSNFGALYKSLGKPYFLLYTQSIRLVLLVLLIYPFTYKFGISGTAMSVALVRIICFPIGFMMGCRLLRCSPWLLVKPLCFCLCITGLIAGTIWFTKTYLICCVTVPWFFALIATAGFLYFGALWMSDGWLSLGYRKILTEQILMVRQKIKSLKT